MKNLNMDFEEENILSTLNVHMGQNLAIAK